MSIEKRIEHVVRWLQDQVKNSGTKGLVLGLSGGIDSSVVAFLIKKAFPNDSVGVILPIKSSPNDQYDAEKVAQAADLPYYVTEVGKAHDIIKDQVLAVLGPEVDNQQLTDANLRARLRMSTLYTFASALNYLVVGTDNAAELHTGYFTKYGDGGVDLLPIARLTKREVYEWGRYLGVPDSVLTRPPSAGLWDGQTDEEEMGVTYNAIDDYLEGKEISKEDQSIIEHMHKRSAHKRLMPPMPPAFPDND